MNERYGKFLAAAPDPWEARRRLVEYARVHGVGAAARMSGACGSAVYKLLKRAEAGTLRPSPRGRPPRLTPEDEARIVAARLAHPEAGALRLRREFGLRHGDGQIKRVLREAGLACRRHTRPDPDPEFQRGATEFRVELARVELALAEIARAHGFTGLMADVGPRRRRLEKAERKAKWWAKKAGPAAASGPSDDTVSMRAALEKLRRLAGE